MGDFGFESNSRVVHPCDKRRIKVKKREILFTPRQFLSTPHIYYISIFSQIQIGVCREIDGGINRISLKKNMNQPQPAKAKPLLVKVDPSRREKPEIFLSRCSLDLKPRTKYYIGILLSYSTLITYNMCSAAADMPREFI